MSAPTGYVPANALGWIDDANGNPIQMPIEQGVWRLDEDDMLLIAMLQDPVYMPELLWRDPANMEYQGCYRVRDYQYQLNRCTANYAGFACARSVGKTESEKVHSMVHVFRRIGQNLLITAPELIHLLPLTDSIEEKLRDTRLTRDFLDTRGGQTGFQHRPFQANFLDGTKVVGRIPRISGTGVKGQHQPDLIVEEAQDYPEKGWIEVHETVMKDTVDRDGNPDFHYWFFGVHSGARDSGFFKRANEGAFKIINVTACMRPGWGKAEKDAAKAAYGGTSSPDYRRNILGEPGAAASAYFVTSRLVACLDQNRESDYNTLEYKHVRYTAEEVDEVGLPINEIVDFPSNLKKVWAGMDVGLTNSPTVITLWNHETVNKKPRLKLYRRYHLERFRTKQIREFLYAMGFHYGNALQGFGMDVTGLGFPIWQEMEDDEDAPKRLMEVSRGYFFNAKVAVGVDPDFVVEDEHGNLRDQYGSQVKKEEDPLSGTVRYVTFMPMIEASTRYLREDVDSTFLLMPFDTEITSDMQGETQQRVKAMGGVKKKPNAFHILDSMRAMAMVRKAGEIEEQLAQEKVEDVMDMTVEVGAPGQVLMGGGGLPLA